MFIMGLFGEKEDLEREKKKKKLVKEYKNLKEKLKKIIIIYWNPNIKKWKKEIRWRIKVMSTKKMN